MYLQNWLQLNGYDNSSSHKIYSRCWEDAISVWLTGTDSVCADVFLLEILNWYLKGRDNVFHELQYSMDCAFKTKFQVDTDQINILIFYSIKFSLYSEYNNYIARNDDIFENNSKQVFVLSCINRYSRFLCLK